MGISAGISQTDGGNNIYIGDAGVAGETDVIGIGGIPATGTPYTACYIGGIAGATVLPDGLPVFVDSEGRLGTVVAGAQGTQPLRRGKGVQPQAMLNRKVEALESTVAQLTAQLKEQAAQIQKVSAQLEMSKPAPQVVNNP